jgi:hypothetical protein
MRRMSKLKRFWRRFWRGVLGAVFLLFAGVGLASMQGCGGVMPAGEAMPADESLQTDDPIECDPSLSSEKQDADDTPEQISPFSGPAGIPLSPD